MSLMGKIVKFCLLLCYYKCLGRNEQETLQKFLGKQ